MSIQAQFDKFLQTAHSKIAFEGPTLVGGACREAVLCSSTGEWAEKAKAPDVRARSFWVGKQLSCLDSQLERAAHINGWCPSAGLRIH
jgi:hypothetical protein